MPLDLTGTIQQAQRAFHDRIASDMAGLQDGGSAALFGTLVLAGFLYGIFHAAGPGHGKVVISGYMLADDHSLKRGLVITALSSLLQSAVAVALVLALFYGLGLARQQTEYVAAWFECVSFGLVALIGAALFVRGLVALNGGGHVHGPDCGHGHAPSAAEARGARGAAAIAVMIASIGMRPCSGALLLMFFACLSGQVWAGMTATFAMGVGTAITTGAIAVAAATSRKGILRLVGGSGERLRLVSAGVKIAGGLVILMLGCFLAFSSMPGRGSAVIAPYQHPLMGHRG